MKKKLHLILVLVLIWLASTTDTLLGQSQMLVDGILPDVTLTDINGEEHILYDVLDSGKHVIIDVFATWCGPCWEYHQSGELQEAYELYGPNGTDELMVFYVEGDNITITSELWGTGNSLGDYVTNTPYPIIESEEFAFDHDITNFPTILYVCPDKEASEIGHLSSEEIKEKLDGGCKPLATDYDVDLLYFSSDMSPSCSAVDYLPQIKVQNGGTQTINHIALKLEVNGTVVVDSMGMEVFLSSYETIDLPLVDYWLDASAEFKVSVVAVNGSSDYGSDYNILSEEKIWAHTTSPHLNLELKTDLFGYETYWEILNENGVKIAFGGNDSAIPGGQQSSTELLQNPNIYENHYSYSIPIELPLIGCYTFRIIDDFGDGICCAYGDGYFSLQDEFGSSIVEGGNFLDDHIYQFDYFPQVTSIDENSEQELLNIYPNPTSDILYIDSDIVDLQEIKIFDVSGHLKVLQKLDHLHEQDSFSISVSDLNSGYHIIRLIASDQSFSIPFIIQN